MRDERKEIKRAKKEKGKGRRYENGSHMLSHGRHISTYQQF